MFASIASQSHKCLSRLGLRFKDPDMESSYQKFNAIIERKLLKVSNILSILLNGLNLILGILGSNQSIVFRIIVLVVSILGAVINFKAHIISKILLLFTSLSSLYVVMINFTKFVNSCLPESFYAIGNAFGLIEMVFTFSLGNVYLKVAYSLASFVMKLVLLRNGLVERTLWRLILMTIIYILYYVYFSTLERKNYQSIYESREQLRKFQSLLSNDFPSSVLIMSSDFETTLYFNHLFKDKFGANYQQDFVLAILERFHIDSFSLSSSQDSHQTHTQNLSDFLKMISSGSIKLSDKEVITISATLLNNETATLYYEIKLRQISWDCKPSYALIFNDISDKQLVTALKIADQHKDRIIATLSHELRTPINGILGMLEIISSKVPNKFAQVYLKHCKSCSKLLLYLVNSILDLSQVQHNTLRVVKDSFNLNGLLDELKSLYLFQSQQKNIEFFIERESNLPDEIYTDKYRLIEILINLLGNAFKFTFKGSITLSVEKDKDTANGIVFSVIDTGVGIKEEDKPKLFKMFGKLNQEDKNINAHGVGLGLTIANELVKALNDNDSNANLLLESEFGKGTKFSFKISGVENFMLPEMSNKPSIPDEEYTFLNEYKSESELVNQKIKKLSTNFYHSSVSARLMSTDHERTSLSLSKMGPYEDIISPKSNSKNILIVDDNPFNILAASFLLEKLKFNVSKAMSGEECLQILDMNSKKGDNFDLILMDIQMPIMDGLETSKIINEKIKQGKLCYVPIVSLSAGDTTPKQIEEYLLSGIVDYLSKPLKEGELVRVLSKWVGKTD